MKRAHSCLVSQGKSDPDVMKFKQQLYDIWFKLYHRLVGFEMVYIIIVSLKRK